MIIINCKKLYLLKKILAIKLPQPPPKTPLFSQIKKIIILISLFIVYLLTQILNVLVL